MSDHIKKEDVLHKLSVIYDMARPDQRAVVTDTIHEVCHMPVENVRGEEDILKFFYCESEDDYYLGMRVDNFYYAKYNKESGQFCWCMSKYLPWGEHVVDKNTLWKEHTYPSEPVEIGFEKWLRGFIKKYVLDVKHGKWIWVKNYRDCEGDIYSQYKCSCCDFNVGGVYSIKDLTHFCGNCGARMNDDVNIQASIEAQKSREQWRDKDSLIKTEVDGLFLNFEQDGDTNG